MSPATTSCCGTSWRVERMAGEEPAWLRASGPSACTPIPPVPPSPYVFRIGKQGGGCSSCGVLGVGLCRRKHLKELLGKMGHLGEGKECAGEGTVAAHSRRPGPGSRRRIGIHGVSLFRATISSRLQGDTWPPSSIFIRRSRGGNCPLRTL